MDPARTLYQEWQERRAELLRQIEARRQQPVELLPGEAAERDYTGAFLHVLDFMLATFATHPLAQSPRRYPSTPGSSKYLRNAMIAGHFSRESDAAVSQLKGQVRKNRVTNALQRIAAQKPQEEAKPVSTSWTSLASVPPVPYELPTEALKETRDTKDPLVLDTRPYWIVYQDDFPKEGRLLFKRRLQSASPRVRMDALMMLGEYGTLEDFTLLMDLAQLPLQPHELLFEREILHRAMQRLAHRSAEETFKISYRKDGPPLEGYA